MNTASAVHRAVPASDRADRLSTDEARRAYGLLDRKMESTADHNYIARGTRMVVRDAYERGLIVREWAAGMSENQKRLLLDNERREIRWSKNRDAVEAFERGLRGERENASK